MLFVINANSNVCRIYQYDKNPSKLTLIKEMAHEESLLKDSEIMSDKPGHYQDGVRRGAYIPRTDPKENEIDKFAREIANELDTQRRNNAYKEIIFIAEPRMSGIVNQHFDKNVLEKIKHNIHKDLIHLNEAQLLDYLKDHPEILRND